MRICKYCGKEYEVTKDMSVGVGYCSAECAFNSGVEEVPDHPGCLHWKKKPGSASGLTYVTRKYPAHGYIATPERAQRVGYTLTFGAIRAGSHIVHMCGDPMCVNPYHIIPMYVCTPFVEQKRVMKATALSRAFHYPSVNMDEVFKHLGINKPSTIIRDEEKEENDILCSAKGESSLAEINLCEEDAVNNGNDNGILRIFRNIMHCNGDLDILDAAHADTGTAVFSTNYGTGKIIDNITGTDGDSAHIKYKIMVRFEKMTLPVLYTIEGVESQKHIFPTLYAYHGAVGKIEGMDRKIIVNPGDTVLVKNNGGLERWKTRILSGRIRKNGVQYFLVDNDETQYRWCLPLKGFEEFLGKSWDVPGTVVLRSGVSCRRPISV